MKLRNKKTGEIIDTSEWTLFCDCSAISIENDEDGDKEFRYNSLAEFNGEWEDYKPKEPLIKDEKIRKCVRLWAEINEFKGNLMYSKFDDCCSFYEADSQKELLFMNRECSNLKHAVKYTIAELCGEEHEED